MEEEEVGEKVEKRITLRELPWKKSPDFREKFADVMRVGFAGERGVFLEFGHVDCEGFEKDGSPKGLHVGWHTRIFVSLGHLKEIGNVISEVVRREEEKGGKEEKAEGEEK